MRPEAFTHTKRSENHIRKKIWFNWYTERACLHIMHSCTPRGLLQILWMSARPEINILGAVEGVINTPLSLQYINSSREDWSGFLLCTWSFATQIRMLTAHLSTFFCFSDGVLYFKLICMQHVHVKLMEHFKRYGGYFSTAQSFKFG